MTRSPRSPPRFGPARARALSLGPSILASLLLGVLPDARAEPTLELYVLGDEVFEGDPIGTSVDADGRIGLGPTVSEPVEGPGHPTTGLVRRRGRLWSGTAGGGLRRLGPEAGQGPVTLVGGTLVSAIAATGDAVWFATHPRAQVFSLDGDGGAPEPLRQLDATYLWALSPDRGGAVVAATGAPGTLTRIAPGGRTRVLFEAPETHLRALVAHPEGGFVAGGGERGVVYRVPDRGAARALYDSELHEVTSLVVDPDRGDVYAAFVSASRPADTEPGTWIPPVGDDPDGEDSPFTGSEVVRIGADGEVRRLWSAKREGALALAFLPEQGRLLVGTGGPASARARVYAIDREDRDRVVLAARIDRPMVTAILAEPEGALRLGTAPDGALFRLGPRRRARGDYLSVEQDLRRVARYGRLWFDAQLPEGSRVEIALRTGNTREPDGTWSAWSEPVADPEGGSVAVPPGRFAQFRARLIAGEGGETPELRSMHASVRRANLPPELLEVFPLRPGVYLKPIPAENESEKTTTLTAGTLDDLRRPPSDDEGRLRVRAGVADGQRTLAWKVRDPNGDELSFDVALVAERGGARWTLAEGTEHPFVSFDARTHPDGRYRAIVRATDRPANAPEEALFDERSSEVFVLDNTPPSIRSIRRTAAAGGLRVTALARDASSKITSAQVSVDGGPWLALPAADGMFDQEQERLSVDLPEASPEAAVRIRVEDAAGNRTTR